MGHHSVLRKTCDPRRSAETETKSQYVTQRRPSADWFGVINLNKPAGWSSRRAVDHVKKIVLPAKVGHAGTLDPLATGVLVICLGQATRLVPYLHEYSKTYRGEFLLGCTSPTDDTEAEIELLPDAPELHRTQIEAALPGFVGEIEQVPPAFSAVKLAGRRAYELARRGRTPQIEPRIVRVDSIRLLAWEAPRLELEIVCGSGTYIRSIGRDLGRSLGSGGVMSNLTRTAIGPFRIDDALAPGEITAESLSTQVLPAQSALIGLPQITAGREILERLLRGRQTDCPSELREDAADEVAVLDDEQRLVLIASIDRQGGMLQPSQVFAPKSGRI
jgi:tRNA pseudouridine55 synthase